MLKSICIKTNNLQIINYLLNKLDTININSIYVSKLDFKKYINLIIHYKGPNPKLFIDKISNILSFSIIEFYELKIIKHMLSTNYFYFSDIDQINILEICKTNLTSNEIKENFSRKALIKASLIEYFNTNKSLILNGFVNFRLKNYIDSLDYILDLSVNKFVIDKEYLEFINLLKTYVNSKESNLNIVHLIYNNQESILLDEFKDTIDLTDNILDTKYISDITFSSNDYALNTLLTLLPKKIFVHMIKSQEDEFINTLKLIFTNRIFICRDCDICKLYSLQKIHK